VLTLAGALAALFALRKADQVAEQGGSTLPFWLAGAAGAAAAAYWRVREVRRPQVGRRGRRPAPPDVTTGEGT